MYSEQRKPALRRRIDRQIAYFERRLRETAEPRTPRQRSAQTRARNCLKAAQRKLRALELNRPLASWVE